MDFLQQSGSDGEQWYKPEVMTGGCTVEDHTGLIFDPRFSLSGLHATLADVQSESAVQSILEGSADYGHYVNPAQKEQDVLRSWNRPTLNWSLECEGQGMTREYALQAVNTTNTTLVPPNQEFFSVWFCGICMIIIYSLALICMCGGLPDGEHFGGYAFQRFSSCIFMPLTMVRIYQARDQVKSNLDRLDSLQLVADCMDEYTQFNAVQIKDQIQGQLDTLNMLWTFALVCVGLVAFEVGIAIVIGLYIFCFECFDVEIKTTFEQEWQDFKAFVKFYFKFN